MTTEIEALLAEVRALPDLRPAEPHEAEALLARVKSAAARWADVLYEIQESTHGLVGPRTTAALEVAYRRAEESYVELEIALGDTARRTPEH